VETPQLVVLNLILLLLVLVVNMKAHAVPLPGTPEALRLDCAEAWVTSSAPGHDRQRVEVCSVPRAG
jgi:hypothetical protein